MKRRGGRSARTRGARARNGEAASHPFRKERGKDGATGTKGGAGATLPGQRSDAHTQIVQIEKPIYGGAFLARVEGKAMFVPLVLPGEQARVRVVEEKRGYATAEAQEIVAGAPERVAPACRHFGACGGCQYQHAEYAAQLEYKKAILRETLERGGVRPPEEIDVLAAEPWAYRNRIRVAFDAQGTPGYRGRRSHGVIPIAECPIAAPLLLRAALAAGAIAREPSLRTRLSEMTLFCNADESAWLASAVVEGAKSAFETFARMLAERVPELKGMEFALMERGGQLPRKVAEWGTRSLLYRAAEYDYRVDQGAFFQVNRWLVDALVERATAGLHGELAWDLFAGVGLFARRLAESFTRVVAVEPSPAAMDALKHNLRGTSATPVQATTLEFLRGASKGRRSDPTVPDLIAPDLIVLDPPRTGLGAETTALLGEIAATALTYVSCDPATLTRDLRALVATGYAIESVTLADLFPQTFHLETVVRLRR
jgi:23S rRNA (uracil1939-C5)-methyltransferase